MYQLDKQLDSTQCFRGFVHEVLDLEPTPGGLRALAAHPRESSPGEQGETAVVFFAPGIHAVAVAAWKWKRWTIDSRPWHGLFRILEEPMTHFIADSSIVSLRLSLLKLNEILTARALGDPIADILLISSASGAALELAHLAKTKLRFVRLPACASLKTYLEEFPANVPTPVSASVGDRSTAAMTTLKVVNSGISGKSLREDPKEWNRDDPDEQKDAVEETEKSETTLAAAGGQALPICPAIALLPPNPEHSGALRRAGQKVLRSVSVVSRRRVHASRLACEDHHFELPDALLSLSPAQRKSRCTVSHELCTLDGKRIFLLGDLPLPVHGMYAPYCLRLWAEVEPQALLQTQGWYAEGPDQHPPLPAELANRVPLVPTTTGLPILIHFRDKGARPIFILRDSEHPLSAEQQMGIGLRRAEGYARARSERRDWAEA
jgi:hypothetical protein